MVSRYYNMSVQEQEKFWHDFQVRERKRIEMEEKRKILHTIRRTTVDDSVREKLKPSYRNGQRNDEDTASLYSKTDRYILPGSDYSMSLPFQPINDLVMGGVKKRN